MSAEKVCPNETAIRIVGDKWVLRILKVIYTNEALRFNELMTELDPVSSKTLSVKLKRLMKEGIITKEVVQLTPLVATYALSEKGADLMSALEPMAQWGERWNG